MECEKVGGKVEELVKIVTDRQTLKKKQQVNGKGDLQQLFKSAENSKTQETQPLGSGLSETNDTGRNLLRLLSQNDNGANSVMDGIKLNNGAEPEKTSASVQDFFAKAVSSEAGQAGSSAFTSVPPGPVTMAPIFSQSQAPQAPIMALPISQVTSLVTHYVTSKQYMYIAGSRSGNGPCWWVPGSWGPPPSHARARHYLRSRDGPHSPEADVQPRDSLLGRHRGGAETIHVAPGPGEPRDTQDQKHLRPRIGSEEETSNREWPLPGQQ